MQKETLPCNLPMQEAVAILRFKILTQHLSPISAWI